MRIPLVNVNKHPAADARLQVYNSKCSFAPRLLRHPALLSEEQVDRIENAECVVLCSAHYSVEWSRFEIHGYIHLPHLVRVDPNPTKRVRESDVPLYLRPNLTTEDIIQIRQDEDSVQFDAVSKVHLKSNYMEVKTCLSYDYTIPTVKVYGDAAPYATGLCGVNKDPSSFQLISSVLEQYTPFIGQHLMTKLRQKIAHVQAKKAKKTPPAPALHG